MPGSGCDHGTATPVGTARLLPAANACAWPCQRLAELLGEGEGGIWQLPTFPVPSPAAKTRATSSTPRAMSGGRRRARAARAGCSRGNPTPLLPGDKEHWGGFVGSAVPACFERVPSGDHAPAVSRREQRLLFAREGASLDGEGWRKEGCFAAPPPAAKAGHAASCASGWPLITHTANKGKELIPSIDRRKQHCLRIKGTAKQEIQKKPPYLRGISPTHRSLMTFADLTDAGRRKMSRFMAATVPGAQRSFSGYRSLNHH